METDLELAALFKEKGDNVTILKCTGQLRSCLVNPKHNLFICASCKSKYRMAINLAGLSNIKILSLPVSNYSYKDVPMVFSNTEELKNYKFQGADLGVSVLSTL